MANNILSANKIDVSKMTFVVGPPKANRSPSINMKNEGQSFQILLPAKVLIPGGLWVRVDEKTGVSSYTLSFPLKGCDEYAKARSTDGSDTGALYNFLLDLEELVVQQALENSTKWFGKKRSEAGIRESFAKILSVSTDTVNGERVPNGKYPPSFRIKVPVYEGRVKSDIVDGNGNPIYATPESLTTVFTKGVSASLVISGSVYTISGGSFGVTWRLTFARVYPQSKLTAKDVFKDETPDVPETEQLDDAPPAEESAPAAEEAQVEAQVEEKPVSRRKKAAGASV